MNRIMRKLERLVTDNGGDEYILDMIAAGTTVGELGRSLEVPGHGGVSRSFLYRWRDRFPARKEGWRLAMREQGHALAEQAGEVLDALGDDPTSAQVARAKSRSEYKRWLAGKRNREVYGDGPAVQVNVLTAGDLHLDALRQLGSMGALKPEALPVPEAEYEVLESG